MQEQNTSSWCLRGGTLLRENPGLLHSLSLSVSQSGVLLDPQLLLCPSGHLAVPQLLITFVMQRLSASFLSLGSHHPELHLQLTAQPHTATLNALLSIAKENEAEQRH